MSFENATPRPWTLGDEIELRPEGIQIFAWQGPIRVCPATTSSITDARLIVTAVNAYDALIEACDWSLRESNRGTSGRIILEESDEADLRAALKLARAET